MKRSFTSIIVLCFFLLTWMQLSAQDFIYQPTNPAFGGNPLNYSWLLSSANAQNTILEPENSQEDIFQDFEENFSEQFLNDLRREILRDSNIFGEDGLTPGTFEFGNLLLDITAGLNGLVITINDINTGAQTQITVPYD